MPLGGAEDEHFSCFHSSCQLGLKYSFLVQNRVKLRFLDVIVKRKVALYANCNLNWAKDLEVIRKSIKLKRECCYKCVHFSLETAKIQNKLTRLIIARE